MTVVHLQELAELLKDRAWHPAAIPLQGRRCILQYNSRRARRVRRWYLARLLDRTNQHNQHDGPALEKKPVYGDDDDPGATTESDFSDTDIMAIGNGQVQARLLTWNVNGPGRSDSSAAFLQKYAEHADIICLQEVTPGMLEDLRSRYGEAFDITAPRWSCGVAWPVEEFDVAIMVRKERFRTGACKWTPLLSDQERGYFTVRLRCETTGLNVVVGTTHLESGYSNTPVGGRDTRSRQLTEVTNELVHAKGDAVVLAGDVNLRPWEAREAKMGEDGGSHWQDAWHAAGGNRAQEHTYQDKRYDRVYMRRREAVGSEAHSTAELVPGTFSLEGDGESDHRAVRCEILFRRAVNRQGTKEQVPGLGKPLCRGVKGRVCGHGVARSPTKACACAKMEQHTQHDPGGPRYYCGKGFEKPRIPVGDAAVLEDERRRNLWRLHMPRNSPYINGYWPGITRQKHSKKKDFRQKLGSQKTKAGFGRLGVRK